MGGKTEGRKRLEASSKKEYLSLRSLTYAEVARLYGISYSSVSLAMRDMSKMYGLYKPYKKRNEENLKLPIIEESVPFSYNEDDYGKHNQVMITKKGILRFNGNSALKEPKPTALQIAIAGYKEMRQTKFNNLINS